MTINSCWTRTSGTKPNIDILFWFFFGNLDIEMIYISSLRICIVNTISSEYFIQTIERLFEYCWQHYFPQNLKTLLQQQWIILSGVSFILLEICFGSLKNCICLQRTFCKNLLFFPSFLSKKKSVTETLYATKCTKKSPCCANIPKQICIGTYRMIRMDGKNFRLLKSKSDALKKEGLDSFLKKAP